jgi:hypothetical protein
MNRWSQAELDAYLERDFLKPAKAGCVQGGHGVAADCQEADEGPESVLQENGQG